MLRNSILGSYNGFHSNLDVKQPWWKSIHCEICITNWHGSNLMINIWVRIQIVNTLRYLHIETSVTPQGAIFKHANKHPIFNSALMLEWRHFCWSEDTNILCNQLLQLLSYKEVRACSQSWKWSLAWWNATLIRIYIYIYPYIYICMHALWITIVYHIW